mgnify:CR=1 FL=1
MGSYSVSQRFSVGAEGVGPHSQLLQQYHSLRGRERPSVANQSIDVDARTDGAAVVVLGIPDCDVLTGVLAFLHQRPELLTGNVVDVEHDGSCFRQVISDGRLRVERVGEVANRDFSGIRPARNRTKCTSQAAGRSSNGVRRSVGRWQSGESR